MAYSYQDFENAAKNAGLLGNFSQYDLDLARRYPEAGLSILSHKQDYNAATTDEQRALANAAANLVRSSYGSYTGGDDGSRYYGIPAASAGDYSPAKYGGRIDDALDRIGSFGDYSYKNETIYQKALNDVLGAQPFSWDGVAPEYSNAYAEQQKALLDAVLNRPDFSWSKEADPQWSSYKKSYLREGDRATANALAQASAASGGRASSYAVNAASQAGDYYAAQLNDIIPTLYRQAYNRYLQEYQMKLSDLGAVNAQEQTDYNRYLTELGQYNTDRNFAYNAYQGQQNIYQRALDALRADREQDYNQYLNEYDMLQTYLGNLQGRDDTMYSRYLDSLSRQTAEREYAGRQAQQALENQLAQARLGASYGDYAGLNALGITPDMTNIYEAALAEAGRVTPVGSGGNGKGGGNGSGSGTETGGTAPAGTGLDYQPDEGIFTWNGARYNSLRGLIKAINAAGLTGNQKTALERTLKAYGFTVELN